MTEQTNKTWLQWILEALLILMLVGAAYAVCAIFLFQVRSDPIFSDRGASQGKSSPRLYEASEKIPEAKAGEGASAKPEGKTAEAPASQPGEEAPGSVWTQLDMYTYDDMARKIAKGNFRAGTGTESPLYPRVFLPLVYLITGGDMLETGLILAGLHAINVLLIFLIARKLFARPTAIAAAVIAILYLPFIIYSAVLLSETLLNTAILLMMLILLDLKAVHHENAPLWHFLVAGITIGLAAAAKPTVLVFVPFALLWIIVNATGGAKPRLSRVGMCLAGVVLMMIPFIIWGYVLTGSVMPLRGNSGAMFHMGNNPTANGAYGEPTGEYGRLFRKAVEGKPIAEQDRIAYRLAFDFIRRHPKAFLHLLVEKLKLFWGHQEIGNNLSVAYYRQVSFLDYPPFLSFGLILPAAIIGAFLAIPRFRTVWIIYAFILVYCAAIVLFVVVGRYRLAVVPFLIIFAGHCCAMIGRWFAAKRLRPAIGVILLMAVLLVLIYSDYLWRVAYPHIEGTLSRRGFSWRMVAVDPDEFLLRDDTGRLSDYGALLKPPQAARKILHVPPELLDRAQSASLAIYCTKKGDAKFRILLNGAPLKPAGPPSEIPGGLTFPISPTDLRAGKNEIVIEPIEGEIKIALDDYYDFNRSAVRNAKGEWRTDRLDTETCKTFRSLHIADGEFMIRIKIDTKKHAPDVPAKETVPPKPEQAQEKKPVAETKPEPVSPNERKPTPETKPSPAPSNEKKSASETKPTPKPAHHPDQKAKPAARQSQDKKPTKGDNPKQGQR